MSNYEIYQIHGALTADGLKEAIHRFHQRHNHLPYAIAAHHTQIQRLRILLNEIQLHIPAHDNGGCLQHELWMQTNNTKEVIRE